MSGYNSKHTGKQIDDAIDKIPQITPAKDSVIVVDSNGNPTYKAVSDIGSNVEIVQITGQATDVVMSQKAVTDELNKKGEVTNLENGKGASAVQQKQDGTSGKVDFTGKNENATRLDSELTGEISYGATGAFSAAFGGKSAAQGKRSFAAGTTTIAKGDYSAAFGDNSVALGYESFAEGYETVAAGQGSHSEGNETQAKGKASHAQGAKTIAEGDYSSAEGSNTKAGGESSHAEGSEVEVQGKVSHGEGYSNKIKTEMPSSEESGGSSSETPDDPTWDIAEHLGEFSHVEGLNNLEYGYASHVQGFNNKAYAHVSHVEGGGNTAGKLGSTDDYYVHVEGKDNKATGKFVHVEGQGNTADGTNIHVEGYNNKANGSNVHVGGEYCEATDGQTFAHGYGLKAGNYWQSAFGCYNDNKPENAFEIGTGEGDTKRKNGFAVLKDGRAKVASAPKESDDVVRKEDLENSTKEPFYNLIEKVITGYTALTAEPEDFATNYANYYKTNGKARNDKDFNYVALTEAETFEAGKFYSYIDEASSLTRNGDSGKEPDGTAYSFKNLYIYGETKDISTYFADYGWAYFYINNSPLLGDAGFVYFSSASSKSHRGELFANVQGNSFRGYTTSLSNTEDNGSKINYSSMKFRDTEVTLTGINMSKLPAGTTILIYGVRK